MGARTRPASVSATNLSASAGRATRRSARARSHAFFELHIEQGPILEDEGIDIGVVTHGQGLKWLQVTLTGREAHTGSTPMPKRRNAGLGMARVTELVHEIAMDYQPDAVGAIGHMEVYPNSRNIIAGTHGLHHRHPLAGEGSARRDGRSRPRGHRARSARRSTSITRSSRSAISIRSLSTRTASRRSASGRTARLFASQHRVGRRPRRLLDQPRGADGDGDVPVRRRPSATTRPRTSRPNGRPPAATCCSMRWSRPR